MVKPIFACDDTIIEELEITREAVQCLCDYMIYSNEKLLISEDCWNGIQQSKIPDIVKKILKGCSRIDVSTGDKITSTVKFLNFESQFRPLRLLTRRNYSNYTAIGLSQTVPVISFGEAHKMIEEDEDFQAWRSTLKELWKIQKINAQKSFPNQD